MIVMTLFISLGCLGVAPLVYQKARRLATATPVTATVVKVWSKRTSKTGSTYFARLIFDRKQNDGEIIHCDVPDVVIGPPTTVGAMIKVAPRPTTCWEPDIICETCAAPSNGLALGILIVAVASGLVCFLQIRAILRERNETPSNV
jgi:hypothetical protein